MPRWPVKEVTEIEPAIDELKNVVEEKRIALAPKAIQLHHEYSFQDTDGVWFKYPARLTFRRPETIKLILDAHCPYIEVE